MGLKKAEIEFRASMAAYGLKFCTCCKVFKPVGMFRKDKRERDGMVSRCAECDLEKNTRYREGNRDKDRERKARYRAKNRDKLRERNARYYAENPEADRMRSRRRRARKHRVARSHYTESAILSRNNGVCVYCDAAPASEVDHFVPISWGGDDAEWNLVGACKPCNSSKCDADPYVWLESRGVDVAAWEARHVAGWSDLPRRVWKAARVYRPPGS